MPTPVHSPAEALLLDLCRRDPRVDRRAVGAGLEADRAFVEFAGLALRHAVQGLVFGRLLALGEDNPFPSARHELQQALSLARRQALFWDMEQDRVLTALDREGQSPLVLKGGALRRGWFAPTERAMGDLDILVDDDAVEDVTRILESIGYRSEYSVRARSEFRWHHHHERLAHPGGFQVEIHWRLTRPGEAIQLDHEAFQARAVTLSPERGPALRVPSPEDLLIHTVSQCEQDSVRRLRRLVDLDRILDAAEAFDWAHVRARAARAGLEGTLSVTLRLAQLLLGTPVPADLARGAALGRPTRAALAALDPVRRILDEPGRWHVVDHYLFRLWCARPDHRARWLRRRVSGTGDPLEWVWEGVEEPDDVDDGTTGVSFGLKLLAYQSILLRSMARSTLDHGLGRHAVFWAGS